MLVKDILAKHKIAFSFEFFPPKTEKAAQTLYNTIEELVPLGPSFISVTYGAGGSTRELTHDLLLKIKKETNLTVVSHLTCVGAGKKNIYQIIKKYDDCGINNILALRGDPPKGESDFVPHEDGFHYATDLVSFIKKEFPHMGIGVAGFPEGHPSTPNRLVEMDNLKVKVDAGADYICTQLFFDNRDFYDFRERCELAGIHVPIIAGIMPVTGKKNMERMAQMALGAHFPAGLLKAMNRTTDDNTARNVGIHWATEQVRDLIGTGVRGVHFYTLNRSDATRKIYESLGVHTSAELEK